MAIFPGTQIDDVIAGTPDDDIITGLAGEDVINGAGGNDTITGGADNDNILGGAGDDTIIVESVDDLNGPLSISTTKSSTVATASTRWSAGFRPVTRFPTMVRLPARSGAARSASSPTTWNSFR